MTETSFDRALKITATAATLISFAWGVYVWRDNSKRDASKPFLELQLNYYKDATRAAATIATSNDKGEIEKAKARFWELYWGDLALVEDLGVEDAMINFGKALNAGVDQEELWGWSIQLAHACRLSLDQAWGVNIWTDRSTIARKATESQPASSPAPESKPADSSSPPR